MLFSSITFLYVFLPVVCLLYFLCPKAFRNIILLIASIIFYAWGEPKYFCVMLITIVLNYFGARLIDRFKNYKKPKTFILIMSILLDFGFLFYFKYFDFLIENINSVFHSGFNLLNIALPIGISFYTFQAVSYLIDVYRGEVCVQKSFCKLALYISFFPQLTAGPIIKYHDVEHQLDEREIKLNEICNGLKRFIIGLAKKVIIANTLGSVADKIFIQTPDLFSHFIAWLGAVCYSLQLFFDFSGYSDMAIGLGLIFGFRFPENFNYPYISKSISEFWRRWHISLFAWFKNYVYIPLGGSRRGIITTLRNIGIVFLLTGIWHGAAWNFIIWGIWHGTFIMLEKLLNWGRKDEFNLKKPRFYIIFRHIYTIFILITGWVIFRSENIGYAFVYLKNMFGCIEVNNRLYPVGYYIDRFEIIILFIAVICSAPIFSGILQKTENNKILKIFINIWLIVLLIFSTMTLAASTYNPFIYFRF